MMDGRALPREGRRPPGLRLQLILALLGLVLLSFLPLFFAVASLTRASLRSAREQSARSLAAAVAGHVGVAARLGDRGALLDAMRAHVGHDVDALCVFGESGGAEPLCDGEAAEIMSMRASPPDTEGLRVLRPPGARLLELAARHGDNLIAVHVRVDDLEPSANLVRLVALYMLTFAIAFGAFSYMALTRLIVRPIERLSRAADRVAGGARALDVPRTGAREIAELGASVQAMTEKLLSDEKRLRAKVQELTETTERLGQTKAQLVRSERMASVGRLAAGVAHEIGNPLAAIMGLQDLLLDGELPGETQRDFLERTRRETERIHNVVRDLLDFARPQGLAAADADATAIVQDVVDDVVGLVRPQAEFRSISLERDLPETPLLVAMSPSRLTQVLFNLVMNAGTALNRNLDSERSEWRVTVRAREVGDGRVRIEVEDTGPGISTVVREKVFEPFVTTKDVGDGTGLGLAVCRGLIEAARGEIGIDADYTSGARFYVILRGPGPDSMPPMIR